MKLLDRTLVKSWLKVLARRARSSAERIRYSGNRVACNVCGHTSRSWLHGREFGRCPGCRCATRTRTLWWWLENDARASTCRTLHFAPEPPLERQLRGRIASEYKTCDLRGSHVDLQVDIQKLPLPDRSFDLVLCSHVLEHVPDDRAAVRELRRICTDNGRVLIMVPMNPDGITVEDLSDLDPAERKRRFGEIDHLREYGTDMPQLLREAGFAVEIFEPGAAVPEASRARHGIGPEQLIFICSPHP